MKKWYKLAALLLIPLLGFAYYAISPIFKNVKVDEALPEIKEVESQKNKQPSNQIASSLVIGTVGHKATGTVRIVSVDDKQYIRYENYKTINGPDLYVYLAKDLEAKEYLSISKVKATEGNINYEIPEGVNISEYTYILTWCKAFGVLFNSADISQIQ